MLASSSKKKMSGAGAQHKVAVIYRDGRLFEPEGSAISMYILKPMHGSSTILYVYNRFCEEVCA